MRLVRRPAPLTMHRRALMVAIDGRPCAASERAARRGAPRRRAGGNGSAQPVGCLWLSRRFQGPTAADCVRPCCSFLPAGRHPFGSGRPWAQFGPPWVSGARPRPNKSSGATQSESEPAGLRGGAFGGRAAVLECCSGGDSLETVSLCLWPAGSS